MMLHQVAGWRRADLSSVVLIQERAMTLSLQAITGVIALHMVWSREWALVFAVHGFSISVCRGFAVMIWFKGKQPRFRSEDPNPRRSLDSALGFDG